jgi:hypothetical protein
MQRRFDLGQRDELGRGENINHGIGQLSRLRDLIDTEQVRNRLVSRIGRKLVGAAPLKERCRFLVYTLDDFDIRSRHRITMYEWNTFRNFLQGQMLLTRRDLDGAMQHRTGELDFLQP